MPSDPPHARPRARKAPAADPSPPPLQPLPGSFVSLTDRPDDEAPFRAIVELAPDAILVTDAAGRITLVNRQTEHLFGYAREELLGQPVDLLLPERFREVHRHRRAHYMAAPRTRPMGTHLQLWGRHRDGHEFPVEVSLSPLPADGTPDGADGTGGAGGADGTFAVTCTIRDLTERRRLERAQATAEAASQELRRLQAITDTALAHPQLDDLLDALLAHIQEALAVDNVAILLLENDGRHLVVRAARGPEHEVVGGVHVPVGAGFAGRVAAAREPLAVVDLATFPVVNPLLHEQLRSVVGVPLLVEERLVGVLHMGSATPRRFTEHDVHLLQLVGERVALAVDGARRYAAEQQARAQAAARSAELEATLEAMVDAVGLYDADGHLVRANAALRRLLALGNDPHYHTLTPDERAARIRGRRPDGRPLSPEDYGLTRLLRGEVLTSDDPAEVVVAPLDGREMWLSITGAPLRGDDGRVVGAVAVTRDVTERRQLERRAHEALEALLAMARALVERPASEMGDTAATQPATRELAHRLAELTCRVLGCRRVGLLAVEPETRRQHALAVVGLAAEQETEWWAEQEHLPRYGEGADPALLARFEAGEALVVDMTEPPYDALPNPYGITTSLYVPMRVGAEVVGILSLDHGGERHAFTDDERALAGAVAQLAALVIERERLLHERAEAQANALALRDANVRMQTFLSIASHELRTPVTIITTNLQLLARRLQAQPPPDADAATLAQVGETVRTLVERGQRGAGRLKRLVDDLVDVSRIQAGKLDLHPQACDFAALVRECVEEQRQTHLGRVIDLALPQDRPVLAMVDPDRIGQVVTNYLTNALKYSDQDRPVEVRLDTDSRSRRTAQVSVHDQGPGLSPEQQQHIWDPFYRAEGIAVRSGSGIGLGLGLHISKTIVERHGGQVGVQSREGEGSTFWFTLPLAGDTSARSDLS